MTQQLTDRAEFFDTFTARFFSVDGQLKVSEDERQQGLKVCLQPDERAALACMEARHDGLPRRSIGHHGADPGRPR